jgi:hypothetical protein
MTKSKFVRIISRYFTGSSADVLEELKRLPDVELQEFLTLSRKFVNLGEQEGYRRDE